MPGVVVTRSAPAGRSHVDRALASRGRSFTRAPRAGHAVRSTREVSAQRSPAVRTRSSGPGSPTAVREPGAGRDGADPWPATESTNPVITAAVSAPHRNRTRRLRRSRSVGRVCTEQASNSLDVSRARAAAPADSSRRFADRRALSGSGTSAARSSASTTASASPSTRRSTNAARPAAGVPARAWPRAISSAPPARGNSRSPQTTGSVGSTVRGGGSPRGQPRGDRPCARAERTT